MKNLSTTATAILMSGAIILGSVSSATAQIALPQNFTNVSFADLTTEAVYTIDLDTMAPRPFLEVEVTADAAHPDLVVEVEYDQCTLIRFNTSPEDPPCLIDLAGSGANPFTLRNNVWACEPDGPYAGETCDIEVRVLDFGAAGPPAQLDIKIDSKTKVLTGLQRLGFEPTVIPPVTVSVPRWRDTTIYERVPTSSNGQGQSIVVGEVATLGGFPPTTERDRIHGLVAFDVTAAIPPSGTINEVEIVLESTEFWTAGGPPLSVELWRIADDGSLFGTSEWNSGDVDADDPELVGGISSFGAATWLVKTAPPQEFWNTQGGDTVGARLDEVAINSLGALSFQSPALLDVVRDMHLTGDDRDGFLLKPSNLSQPLIGTQAVQFASGENGTSSIQPVMIVEYTPAFAPPVDGQAPTGAVNFIGEGENLRWIYDEEVDGFLQTEILGECTITEDNPADPQFDFDYAYAFKGDPSYVGLDCCAWEIESTQTGTFGSGQLIFFIGLDPNDPSNFPGDFDGDGMRDLCDNCPYTPNGPLLGSCMGGTNELALCQSNLECLGGGTCSQAQEDDDYSLPGLACPEPGFSTALLSGLGLLASQARRRRGVRASC